MDTVRRYAQPGEVELQGGGGAARGHPADFPTLVGRNRGKFIPPSIGSETLWRRASQFGCRAGAWHAWRRRRHRGTLAVTRHIWSRIRSWRPSAPD